MAGEFDAKRVAVDDRQRVADAFKQNPWPDRQALEHMFDDVAKDPAKFNAVVAEMKKMNDSSHDGLVVSDQKSINGNVEFVKFAYHVNPKETRFDSVGPQAATDRARDEYVKYQAKEESLQWKHSFSPANKNMDQLADEVRAQVRLSMQDPHVNSIGYSKSLRDSFQKLDPVTFAMLTERLLSTNSAFSAQPQVQAYGGSNGFAPYLVFRPGNLDFDKPLQNNAMYFAKIEANK